MSKRPLVVADGQVGQLEDVLNLGAPIPVTLISGTITINRSIHVISAITGGTSLTVITGGEAGDILIVQKSVPDQITLDGGGNLLLPTSRKLKDPEHNITLLYNGTAWVELNFTG